MLTDFSVIRRRVRQSPLAVSVGAQGWADAERPGMGTACSKAGTADANHTDPGAQHAH